MSNFGGGQATTLHSWAGVGVTNGFKTLYQESQEISKRPDVLSRWIETDTLIIEEISMVSPAFYQKLYDLAACFNAMRMDYRKNLRRQLGIMSKSDPNEFKKGFHGIQIIVCGDWAQLEPVRKSDPPEFQKMNFCFETEAWKKSIGDNVVILDQIYRQKDPEFIKILSEIRHGILTPESKAKLQSRLVKNWDDMEVRPITLYPRLNQVQKENDYRLSKLKGDEKVYQGNWHQKNLTKEQFNILSKKMLSNFPIENEPLNFKEGASVLLIVNLSVPLGLVNGLQGIIKRFEKIRLNEGEENYDKEEDEPEYSTIEYPVVEFENGMTLTVQNFSWHESWNKDRHKIEKKINGFDKKKIINWKHKDWVGLIYNQLPLKLGFSISIHKAQGMGFEKVALDLGPKVFTSGQCYTALSRAKTLKGIYLLDFAKESVIFNEKVIEFYEKYSTDDQYSSDWRKKIQDFQATKSNGNNNNNSFNKNTFNTFGKRTNSFKSKSNSSEEEEQEDKIIKPRRNKYSKNNNNSNNTPPDSSGCPF